MSKTSWCLICAMLAGALLSSCAGVYETEGGAAVPAKAETTQPAAPTAPSPVPAKGVKAFTVSKWPAPVVVDGMLTDQDYQGLAPLLISSNAQVVAEAPPLTGPSDLTASVLIGHTDKALYLAVKVQDDVLDKGDAYEIRTGDSIALYFSNNPYAWREGVNRILIRPTVEDRQQDTNVKGWESDSLDKAVIATKSGAWGYNLEMEIPMEALERMAPSVKENGSFLLQIAIFDSDAAEAGTEKTVATINGTPPDLYSADGYATFVLK